MAAETRLLAFQRYVASYFYGSFPYIKLLVRREVDPFFRKYRLGVLYNHIETVQLMSCTVDLLSLYTKVTKLTRTRVSFWYFGRN